MAAVVHLLETESRSVSSNGIWPTNSSSGVLSCMATWTPDAGVAGTGAARHHRRGGAPGQLAVCLGHVDRPGLEPARHQFDVVPPGIQAIQYVEVAFARHGEDVADALGHEGVRQDAAPGASAGASCCGLHVHRPGTL